MWLKYDSPWHYALSINLLLLHALTANEIDYRWSYVNFCPKKLEKKLKFNV
jgi:hypothetical protein